MDLSNPLSTVIWLLFYIVPDPAVGVLCQFENRTNVSCSLGCCDNKVCCSFWTHSTIDLAVICSVFVCFLLVNLTVRLVKAFRTSSEEKRNSRLLKNLFSKATPSSVSPESGEVRHYDVDNDMQQSSSYYHTSHQECIASQSSSSDDNQSVENGLMTSHPSQSHLLPSTSSGHLANADLHHAGIPQRYRSISVRDYFNTTKKLAKHEQRRTASFPALASSVVSEESTNNVQACSSVESSERTRLLPAKDRPSVKDYQTANNIIY